MKTSSIRSALQVAIFGVAFSLAAAASDTGDFFRGAVQGRAEYCTDCHGVEGQGYLGWYPMPRLAGQQPEYFQNQLRAFVTQTRGIAIFTYKVHDVGPAKERALAALFNGLNPPPFGEAPEELAATGRKIYEEGVPGANVPACSACHGPNAQGEGRNPRLAGQLYTYVVKELTNWTKERAQQSPSETVAVMTPIAAAMSEQQIKAVAAYLACLR